MFLKENQSIEGLACSTLHNACSFVLGWFSAQVPYAGKFVPLISCPQVAHEQACAFAQAQHPSYIILFHTVFMLYVHDCFCMILYHCIYIYIFYSVLLFCLILHYLLVLIHSIMFFLILFYPSILSSIACACTLNYIILDTISMHDLTPHSAPGGSRGRVRRSRLRVRRVLHRGCQAPWHMV